MKRKMRKLSFHPRPPLLFLCSFVPLQASCPKIKKQMSIKIIELKFYGVIHNAYCMYSSIHTHLLFELLVHSCHACCAVFFVGFHFLVKLLLCHLAEVVVLLHCFLKDLLLMLSFLSQMLQDLCLMVLT